MHRLPSLLESNHLVPPTMFASLYLCSDTLLVTARTLVIYHEAQQTLTENDSERILQTST